MSEQFDFKDQDVDLKTVDYMKLLDTDRDQMIGFFDFLQPIMNFVPAEVLAAFTQDQRFKQEVFYDLRLAFDAVKTVGPNKVVSAEVNLVHAKLIEKGAEESKLLTRAFDQLLHITGNAASTNLVELDFLMGVMRLEKRALLNFTSQLFQEEEERLRGMVTKTTNFVPDGALKQALATAIDDEDLSVGDAKALLCQLRDKMEQMETRLFDYEDTSHQMKLSHLPQAQSRPKDLWNRFRRCLPSFMDIILDSEATITD